MNELTINNTPLSVKEYDGRRVVTLKDIDTVHGRRAGTARKRFNDNKERFIEGEDFFKVCASEIRTHNVMEIPAKAQEDMILLTETGYLMLVKSFTDDLAWQVQRALINSYFRQREQLPAVPAMTSDEIRFAQRAQIMAKAQNLTAQYDLYTARAKIARSNLLLLLSDNAWLGELLDLPELEYAKKPQP